MTNLLAIDTASDACSVALWLDGEITQQHQVAPRQHVRLALPMVEELLAAAHLRLTQLDGLVLGIGPGSFTGLRIAAGLIQGLAFATALPVVPISTLHTMAQGAWCKTQAAKVLVAVDAGLQEVYGGQYSLGAHGLMTAVEPDRLYLMPEWQALLEALGDDVVTWKQVGAEQYPQAQHLAQLGYYEFMAGHCVDAEQAQPVYLRRWSPSQKLT